MKGWFQRELKKAKWGRVWLVLIVIIACFGSSAIVGGNQVVTVKIRSDPNQGGDSLDAQIDRHGDFCTWDDLHDGDQSLCAPFYTQIPAGWDCSSKPNRFKRIYRIKVSHDLSIIPLNSTILSVSYYLNVHEIYKGGNPNLAFALFELTTGSYINCYSTDYQSCGVEPISNVISVLDLEKTQFAKFGILPAYLHLFKPGQKSVFSVREYTYDALDVHPPWSDLRINRVDFHAVDSTVVERRPYLEVTYMELEKGLGNSLVQQELLELLKK